MTIDGGETAARRLGSFVTRLCPESLPPAVVEHTKFLLLDYLGVALAGARTETADSVWNAVRDLGGAAGPAIVLGRGERGPPAAAALHNGTAAHCLEMDDTHHGGSIHLGATMFSAALAGAALRPCSGSLLLTAAVAGYEVAARVAMALDPRAHYARGFHPTGTCGAFGAAATTARLLGIDVQRTTWALGIAGSQAAGSMEFLADGAWTKRLHPGWAAGAGLHAAVLARRGVRGPESVFEGRDGFLHAHSDRPVARRLDDGLGSEYETLQTSIKPHACCRYTQAPIDGVLELQRFHGFQATDVDSVTVGMLEAGIPIVCEPRMAKVSPASVVDAQFSLPFGIAVALLYGRASPAEYREEVLRDPALRALTPRVTWERDPDLDAQFPRQWPAWVRVRLRDGRELFCGVQKPRGDPDNALTWHQLRHKVRDLLTPQHDVAAVTALCDAVKGLDTAPTLDALLDTLAAFAPPPAGDL